ncbi:MAG: hypothetical protein ACRDIA_05530, partial [Actinomycetota bacterium]
EALARWTPGSNIIENPSDRKGISMRILRSKPVVILAATGLAKRIKDRTDARKQRKRARVGKTITGLALAGAAGGAIRYFADSARGSQRRQKVMSAIKRGQDRVGGADTFTVPDTSPATGL